MSRALSVCVVLAGCARPAPPPSPAAPHRLDLAELRHVMEHEARGYLAVQCAWGDEIACRALSCPVDPGDTACRRSAADPGTDRSDAARRGPVIRGVCVLDGPCVFQRSRRLIWDIEP